jgi:poly(3-hydroxybutyrate) depolymerase
VDRSRIAIAGLSAGASMAALLATRHPGRFKAVVMHSGVPPGSAHSGLTAVSAMHFGRGAPPAAVAATARGEPLPPLLVIHGSSDRVVSRQNAQAAARIWSQAGGALAVAPREVRRGKRYPMTVTDYERGPSTVATLVEVQQLGHAWSGGAARTAHSDGQGPDASRMIWTFAVRQFESSPAAPS